MATITDVINNLVHPRVVDAFLVSPTFTSRLPEGVQLFLRPHFPVTARADASSEAQDALQGEKYTWAIVDERAGTHIKFVLSAAFVDEDMTDDDFDTLDAALAEGGGGFRMYMEDGEPCFLIGERKITPSDPQYAFFSWLLNGAATARAAGLKVILSNGPRWIMVETEEGLTISRSVGKKKDGSVLDPEGANTSMFGGMVSQAFEAVVTRDAVSSLLTAKAQAGK
ncbi:hypothetical protein CspeluHIS016_0301040 [Cutaneotrichosporon spelunceum]|uniref:Uncharacterized protein n=1 Tax=Cutaneotrichosporon spelunceum TaxID=1672016 RepID=A0AAD3TT22_9TREE|nr:hypothetical protein CspeluHIS016_0301040 [Cutaneotrichosporon spelunceum]